MRVKAAGLHLTVGELREALAGLADNDPVTLEADIGTVLWVEAGAGTLEIGTDVESRDDELEALWEFVADAGTGTPTKRKLVTEARALGKRYGRG
jgi:hypothetical protein